MAALKDEIDSGASQASSSVDLTLASQITFPSPSLATWAYYVLGLLCVQPLSPAIPYKNTVDFIGFKVTEAMRSSPEFADLQEFVSYIAESEFDNPRLANLSDLHPNHHTPLDTSTLHVRRVQISQRVIRAGSHAVEEIKDVDRSGYVLTPINQDTQFQQNWLLIVFDAVSVADHAKALGSGHNGGSGSSSRSTWD